jgi:hypothetical protein
MVPLSGREEPWMMDVLSFLSEEGRAGRTYPSSLDYRQLIIISLSIF